MDANTTKKKLPYDIIFIIFTYFCDKDKYKYNILKTISKTFSDEYNKTNIQSCIILKYKNIHICEIHDNHNLVDAIINLINAEKKKRKGIAIKTIQCKSVESLNYAKKYLSNYGNIRHFYFFLQNGCMGKGVMYDTFQMVDTFHLPPMRWGCGYHESEYIPYYDDCVDKNKHDIEKYKQKKLLINKNNRYMKLSKRHLSKKSKK